MKSDNCISDILNSIRLPRIPDRETVLQAASGDDIREKIMRAVKDHAGGQLRNKLVTRSHRVGHD